MSSRFTKVDAEVISVVDYVRGKWFAHLANAEIGVLFDTRMRKKGPRIILGRMMKANDLIKKLTDHISPEGCDYIMFLDQVAWDNMDAEDRIRLVRHEMRHCAYNPFARNPWQAIPHDIEDFKVEIELNRDSMGWAERIATLTLSIYEQEKEMQKEGKSKRPAKQEGDEARA